MGKYNKIIRMAGVMLAVGMLVGCTQVRDMIGKYESEPKVTVKKTSESEYTYLNGQEEITDYLLATIKENKETCYFNVDSEDMIDAKYWSAKLDGITNISLEYSKVKEGYNVCVSLEYWDNYPIVTAYQKNDTTILTPKQVLLFNKYTQIIGSCVNSKMTTYEKELAIHDYLVQNVEYDAMNSGEDVHTAYGALVNGKAVCDGYSEAFQTLMEMLGIDCRRVVGTGNQLPHSWNMVFLEGAWYNVDVTWDDPIGGLNGVSHKYFNVSDAELSQDHIWEHINYPAAVGNKYSYYIMSGVFQAHNQAEFEGYITKKIKEHEQQINVIVYGNVDFESALKKAGVSFSYTYDIINKSAYKIYEMNIEY